MTKPLDRVFSGERGIDLSVKYVPIVAVCVCTRGRPKMLMECLDSILAQEGTGKAGIAVRIVVVDNNHGADSRESVAEIESDWYMPFLIHYVHEPLPGLSHARNAALDAAQRIGADFIAFIDDDEIAEPDWLVQLYRALFQHGKTDERFGRKKLRPADAAHGVIEYAFPKNASWWRCRNPWGDWGHVDGMELDSAGTGNVIFRTKLAKGLRFDVARGLKGGEDGDFFRRYHSKGGRIILALHAVVTETVPWERITVKGHAKKSFRSGVYKVEAAREMGRLRRGKWARRALKRSLVGLLSVLAGLPLAAFSGHGQYLMLSGARKMAEGCGMATALLGGSYEYYKTTTGY